MAVSLSMLPAAPAVAGKTQLSLFQDDAQLVLSGDETRERALDDLAELGVDAVRSIVFWNRVAPAAGASTRPAGFDGADPAAYPVGLWDKYDGLVRGASIRGMQLVLSPAGPLPTWASGCRGVKPALKRTCRPNPTQYKRFVTALGTRYSGEYADENQGGGVLPRVTRWAVWNEPNQGGWLTPQFARVKGRLMPQSPLIYRGLVRAMSAGLRASGHGRDELLFGETAPLGRKTGPAVTRPMAPGAFLRAALCIDVKGRRLTGATAAALDCKGFRKLAVTGVSHHPYTRGGSRPPTDRGGPEEITISSASRLKKIIRQAAARGRLRSGLKIAYTEFGFQTNPPDRLLGVSLVKQAAYLNQSDWLAYRDPDISSVAQYELRDETNLAGFQTGLRFQDGRPKPGFTAYRMPIWVTRKGSALRVWGQLRPADDSSPEVVEVQNAPPGSDVFTTVSNATTTSRKGFVDTRIPAMRGSFRLRWTPLDGGPTITSRVAPGVGR